MTFEKLKTNKAVLYARLLGFEPFGQALSAHAHFHWYMPEGDDTFAVQFFKGVPRYTVNHETSTNIEQACKWLQKIESKRVTQPFGSEWVARKVEESERGFGRKS